KNRRDLECIYIERDKTTFERLQTGLASIPCNHICLRGSVETHLDSVLVTAKGSPLLAFFDPFGLGIPFLALTNQVMGRPERKTEVILNFSLPGLRRNAGKVLSTKPGLNPKFTKAALTTGRRMDEYLGGGWWRTIWTDGRPDREERILGQYLAL